MLCNAEKLLAECQAIVNDSASVEPAAMNAVMSPGGCCYRIVPTTLKRAMFHDCEPAKARVLAAFLNPTRVRSIQPSRN